MFVLGLDLGTVTGVALGDSRLHHPRDLKSFSMRFRWPSEPFEMAGKNIELWLEQTFTGFLARYPKPDLIIAEASIRPAGHKSDSSVSITLSLNQGLFNFAHDHGIRLERVSADTARVHFVQQGRKRKGADDDMKLIVAERCHRLGYTPYVLPKAKRDQTDAICAWDYGVATFARHRPAGVALLGGVA